ncbi:MAG: hypothetical protein KDG50_07070 [Chromatiales bacterium]|nr:hypothetical protein [Chromatiales bacterium]
MKKVFETVNIPYRDYRRPFGTGIYASFPDSHPELIAPPRQYYETLWFSNQGGIQGLFTEGGQDSPVIICLQAKVQTVEWPGYQMVIYRFNGVTGDAYSYEELPFDIDALISPAYLYMRYMTTVGDGNYWSSNGLSQPIRKFDRPLGSVIASIENNFWGKNPDDNPSLQPAPYLFFIDEPNDLVVGYPYYFGSPYGNVKTGLYVWRFSDGAFIRRIPVIGQGSDVFREDGTRCYAVSTTGILTLVNYASGEVLGVLGFGTQFEKAYGRVRFAWDRFYRRILVAIWTSDNADGSSTVKVEAYYPQSSVVGMSKPIPLAVPRKGRTVPLLVEVRGDAGEFVQAQMIDQVSSGQASVKPARKATDGYGCATFSMKCTDTGTVTTDASTVIE